MARLLNGVSEAVQITLQNPASAAHHAVRYDQWNGGSGVAHTHTASQITDFSAAVKAVVVLYHPTTQTIEWYSEGAYYKAKVRRKSGGGLLEDADGLYVDFPTGVTAEDLHAPVSLGTLEGIGGSIGEDQVLDLSLLLGPGLTLDDGSGVPDWGTGVNQVARGNHTHANDHVPVTVQSTAGLSLTVTPGPDGQLITGTPILDPSPEAGYAPLSLGASGLRLLLGTDANQPKPGDWMPDDASASSHGLLTAALYRKLVLLSEGSDVDQIALWTRHDQLVTGTYVGGIHRWAQSMQIVGYDVTAERYGSGGEVTLGVEVDGVEVDSFTIPDGTGNEEVSNTGTFTDLYVSSDLPVRISRSSGTGDVLTEPSRINVSLRLRPAIGTAVTVRLNAGGTAVAPFSDDAYYDLGTTDDCPDSIDLSGVVDPAPEEVYQTSRVKYADAAALTYTVPSLSRGLDYTVRLHFSENLYTATGKNIFTIRVTGETVEQTTGFDIYALTGARAKAYIQEYTVKPDGSGNIEIRLTPQLGSDGYNCSINAIELLPVP